MITRQNTMVDDDHVDALDEQRPEAPREHRQRDGQQRQPTPLMLHGHGRTLPESAHLTARQIRGDLTP